MMKDFFKNCSNKHCWNKVYISDIVSWRSYCEECFLAKNISSKG